MHTKQGGLQEWQSTHPQVTFSLVVTAGGVECKTMFAVE